MTPTITIGLILVFLVIGWTLLRFVLRLTTRLFACGCLALVLIGIATLVIRGV